MKMRRENERSDFTLVRVCERGSKKPFLPVKSLEVTSYLNAYARETYFFYTHTRASEVTLEEPK
jgi:hypothetical protein